MARDVDDRDEDSGRGGRQARNRRDVIDLGGTEPRRRPAREEADDDDEPRAVRATRRDDERPARDDERQERTAPRHSRDQEADGDRDDDRDARKGDGQGRTDDRSRGAPAAPKGDTKDGKTQDGQGQNKAQDDKGQDGKGQDGKGQGNQDRKEQDTRRRRRPVIILIAIVVVALMIAAGLYYWITHHNKVDTDDAYTDGNVVAIAPQVSGEVVSLDVNDNQFVHKGDPLVHIDPRQYVYSQEQAKGTLDSTAAQIRNQDLGVEIAKKNFPASLQLAQANLDSAKANLQLQKLNFDRQKGLPKQATTQQDVDTATSNYQQAQAQVEQAEARVLQAQPVQQNIGQSEQQVSQLQGQAEEAKGRLDQANLNIEWTVVRAPQDGWVTRRNVNKGNYISAGTQIMSLVTTDVWVTANFKETELDGMRPGQKVAISVDAYPDLDLRGHVDSLQLGSGSRFSAFPAENATGNFIKIVQRVPVKIVIDSGMKADEPLPLGVSVVPTVTLR